MEALHLFSSLLLLLLLPLQSVGQQSYVNNRQLDCNQNYTTTLGFICNAPAASCPSYLTFRSTPTYNTPTTIARLLSANASRIASANNISDVTRPLSPDTLLLIPVDCSCSGGSYYQHNASYVLRRSSETYFTVANGTYQSLTTCQSLEAQNSYNFRQLFVGFRLRIPLRCACPTRNQTAAGFNYLLTYLIRQGDSYESIAAAFSGAGATVQGILDANELSPDRLIYFFTPILVPLRVEPTTENLNTLATPPPPSPPAIPTAPTAQSSGRSSSRRWVFVGIGIGAAAFVLFLLGLLFCFVRRRRRSPPLPPPESAKKSEEVPLPLCSWSVSSEGIQSAIETLKIYRFEELKKATGSFSEANRISGGAALYRGWFKGDAAAVKIMKGDVSEEIELLRQINHSRIIRLSGFCWEQGITYLVYEYAENGSLVDFLRPIDGGKDSTMARLEWKQRLQIAYDVADALNYLHNFTTPPCIHKNLNSSNVLLDSHMRAKVANLGLARTLDAEDGTIITRHVVGTYGYMAPEYIENGLITPKLDVFALGVVMLELLSGKEPNAIGDDKRKIEGNDGESLLLCQSIERVLEGENVREKLQEFLDPWLGEEYPLEVVYSMAQLARSCVAQHLDARPNVSEVFMALSKLLSSSLDWDSSLQLQQSTSFSLSD